MTKQTNKGKIQLNLTSNELLILTKSVKVYKTALEYFSSDLWGWNGTALENLENLYVRLINKQTEHGKKALKSLKEVSDE